MKLKEFNQHLKEMDFDKDRMREAIDLIEEFLKYLAGKGIEPDKCGYEDFYEYSDELIRAEKNQFDNYIHLLRYAKFIDNKALTIAVMEVVDGAEMIENFSTRLERRYGRSIRDAVFEGTPIPKLGIHPKSRPAITLKLIDRLIENIGEPAAKRFLNEGLRDQYIDWYRSSKTKLEEVGSLEKFLEVKRANFVQNLETHNQEKSLFYTQEIDDEVLEYVKERPHMESGILKDDVITVTKIPYMTKQFLEATRNKDEQKRRYYFCHNPWFREGILDKDLEINPIACQISCGYYKDYWQGVLDKKVDVKLTKSVLEGADTCSFEIHLNDN